MKNTFNLPEAGKIIIEGSEEDVRSFLQLVRMALFDATLYCKYYGKYPEWAKCYEELHNCLPEPSPYADPTLDLPF